MIDKNVEIPKAPESEPNDDLKALNDLLTLANSAKPPIIIQALGESFPDN